MKGGKGEGWEGAEHRGSWWPVTSSQSPFENLSSLDDQPMSLNPMKNEGTDWTNVTGLLYRGTHQSGLIVSEIVF